MAFATIMANRVGQEILTEDLASMSEFRYLDTKEAQRRNGVKINQQVPREGHKKRIKL